MLFMQSDGGLTPMNDFCGSRAILSGPAGGVVCNNKLMLLVQYLRGGDGYICCISDDIYVYMVTFLAPTVP